MTSVIDAARRRAADPVGCDAAAVVAERVAFWAVLAEDTDRALRADVASGPLPVAVGRADLEALVDALLGNVFAHTPDGAAFAVRLGPRPRQRGHSTAAATVDPDGQRPERNPR